MKTLTVGLTEKGNAEFIIDDNGTTRFAIYPYRKNMFNAKHLETGKKFFSNHILFTDILIPEEIMSEPIPLVKTLYSGIFDKDDTPKIVQEIFLSICEIDEINYGELTISITPDDIETHNIVVQLVGEMYGRKEITFKMDIDACIRGTDRFEDTIAILDFKFKSTFRHESESMDENTKWALECFIDTSHYTEMLRKIAFRIGDFAMNNFKFSFGEWPTEEEDKNEES